MYPLKKVDKDFTCVSQGLNTFNITTFALAEQDHATLRALAIPQYGPHSSSAIFTALKSRKPERKTPENPEHWKELSGSRRQLRDLLCAALKGFLLATGDAALSETLTGTSFVQKSRFGKLYGLPKQPW